MARPSYTVVILSTMTFSRSAPMGLAVLLALVAAVTEVRADFPPTLSYQPAAALVPIGGPATFPVATGGTFPQSYQWYKNGVAMPNATAATLNVFDATTADTGNYSITVTNAAGSVTSNPAALSLTAAVAPTLGTTLPSAAVEYGGYYSLFPSPSGSAPFAYQWYFNGNPIPGATGPNYVLTYATPANAGSYSVRVTNAAGSVTSNTSVLTVAAPIPVTITQQPASQAVQTYAQIVELSVVATGTRTLTYQWFKDGVALPGETATTLRLTNVLPTDGGTYTVKVTNVAGTVTSAGATLTMVPPVPPTNTQNLGNLAQVTLGSSQWLSFYAGTSNSQPPAYFRWYRDGLLVAADSSFNYQINPMTTADAGDYLGTLTTAAGTQTAPPVTLTAKTPGYPTDRNAWMDLTRQGNVLYFLFASPAQILRYNLTNSTWLAPVSLPQTPTAILASPEGIYVAFGTTTNRYSLDLATSTVFATTPGQTYALFLNDTYVFLAGILYTNSSPTAPVTAIRRSDGSIAKVSTGDYYGTVSASFEVSPATGRAYGWGSASSPSYLRSFPLQTDGSVTDGNPALFVRAKSGKSVVLSPDGSLVFGNNGVVYRATDLSFRAALPNGAWDDLGFLTDGRPVVLRGAQLTLYDSALTTILGSVRLPTAAGRLLVQGSDVIVFSSPLTQGGTIRTATVTVSDLLAGAPAPAAPVTPAAASTRAFLPDDAFVDTNGLVYLLDRLTRNLLVWSPALRAYQASIPLSGVPDHVTYSPTLHRAYVSYSDRRITAIDLDTSKVEQPFTTVAAMIYGLLAVDNQLYVHLSDGDDTGEYRALYSSTGQLVAAPSSAGQIPYVSYWNASTQTLYEYSSSELYSLPVQTAAFGSLKNSANGILAREPLRFSATAPLMVSGRGTIFDTSTLTQTATLGSDLTDATWVGANLLTLAPTSTGSLVQVWTGSNYAAGATASLPGYPLRLWALPNQQILALTGLGSGPVFTLLDVNGTVLAQDSNIGIAETPPAIRRFPLGPLNYDVGDTANLTVVGVGPALTYQWRKNTIDIPGAVQASLTLPMLQPSDAGQYTVVLTNPFGAVTSPVLIVNVPPLLVPVLQPLTPQTALLGTPVTFTISATGTNPVYQWYCNDVALPGATTATLAFASAQPSHNGDYYVRVTANGRTASSNHATLTVVLDPSPAPPPASTAPTITVQPSPVTTVAGLPATFAVTATGTPPPTYQWSFNGTPIPGATSAAYTIASAQAANVGNYTVIVTNASGNVTSQPATLTLSTSNNGPTLVIQPVSRTASPGSTVVFSVEAGSMTGSAVRAQDVAPAVTGLTYLWYYNGLPLSDGNGVNGAQSAMLVLSGTAARAGSYACLVANGNGAVLSQPAVLTVDSTTDAGRLVNLSCRSQVGTGGNVLIAGFVVGGLGTAGTQKILARAAGPALVAYAVLDTLPDPQLKLYAGENLIAANSGWNGNPDISALAADLGAFAWTNPSSHDAATAPTLAGGVYSAVVSGQSGDTGVALVELYDTILPRNHTSSTPRLVNLSARVPVGTGGNVLIAGFVIGGTTSRTLLIRASGPALNAYGVTGTLPNPQLKLYQGTTVLAANHGWGGNAQLASVATSVGAFAWSDPASPDSALLVTLPPGVYSAEVSGANGETGVALVEVYEVP